MLGVLPGTQTKKSTNQKILVKEGIQDQAIHTKQDVPKQRKKILTTSRGRMDKAIPTTGCERGKHILEQNMGMESHNKKAE